MQRDCIERLHQQEARLADLRMVDQALRERTGNRPQPLGRVRQAIGQQMIRIGEQLAGSQAGQAAEPSPQSVQSK
jgi:hypothetical protein